MSGGNQTFSGGDESTSQLKIETIKRMQHAGGRGRRRDVVVEEHGHYLQQSTREVNGVDKLDDVGDDDQRPQHDGDRNR